MATNNAVNNKPSGVFSLPTNTGSNGDVIASNGSGGSSWVAPSSGKLVQVVTGTTNTDFTAGGSTSFIDSNLTATITGVHSGSRIIITIQSSWYIAGGTGYWTVTRGGTNIGGSNGLGQFSSTPNWYSTNTLSAVDTSPGTGTVTYKVQLRTVSGAVFFSMGASSDLQLMILQEIGV